MLPTGQAVTKQTHEHCLKPEANHLPQATKRSQCCDTFGRQTGMALEGCETVNAAKTVSGQYAPVPLTRMANWKQAGSVSSSFDQDWHIFFNRGLRRAYLKPWGTIPEDKDLFMILVTMGIIRSKQSRRTKVGMGSRSQDFWGISWTTVFTKPSVTVWNPAKAAPENSTELVEIGLSGSKLRQISSILCTKNALNLSGRDSGEIFEGNTVSLNLPIVWLLRRKSTRELPHFTILWQR